MDSWWSARTQPTPTRIWISAARHASITSKSCTARRIKATPPRNSGGMHTRVSPTWDLGTAIRYAVGIGYKGRYAIEVNQGRCASFAVILYSAILGALLRSGLVSPKRQRREGGSVGSGVCPMRLFRSPRTKTCASVGACLAVLAAVAVLDRVVLTQQPTPPPPPAGPATGAPAQRRTRRRSASRPSWSRRRWSRPSEQPVRAVALAALRAPLIV